MLLVLVAAGALQSRSNVDVAAAGPALILVGAALLAGISAGRPAARYGAVPGLVIAMGPVIAVAAGLWTAIPHAADPALLATTACAGLILGSALDQSRVLAALARAAIVAVFGALWLIAGLLWALPARGIPLGLGLLVTVILVLDTIDRSTRARLASDTARSESMATTLREAALATDVSAVGRAVMESCRRIYPEASWGALSLLDPETGRLASLPLWLKPDGVGTVTHRGVPLKPGEGLGGSAFSAGRPLLWSNSAEVNAASQTTDKANRDAIRALFGGLPKSAIAAPLLSPRQGPIGVLQLTSHRQERVWNEDDLVVIGGLADGAALAIERAWLYEELREQAITDALTGLLNRRQLSRTLDAELARCARTNAGLAVVFIDLDNFKQVNDRLGHDAGDHVLELLAEIFRQTLRLEDTAIRYGGDEFVCILPGADRDHAEKVVARVTSELADAMAASAAGFGRGVGISAGIAIVPEDEADAETLVTLADSRLIAVKAELHRRPPPPAIIAGDADPDAADDRAPSAPPVIEGLVTGVRVASRVEDPQRPAP